MATGRPSNVTDRLRQVALRPDGGELTDGQLLGCFLGERDEVAFEVLVRRHGPMVLGVCRRILRHTQDTEDAFQATFLVLARKAGAIGQRELLANWLYGVAYRAALEARSSRRHRERQVLQMPDLAAEEEADSCEELRRILDRELNALPEKYRIAIILCDLEGRTRKEVARQLGLPESTLSGRLTTARRMLARRLARHRVEPGDSLLTLLSPGAAGSLPPALVITTTQAVGGAILSAEVAAIAEGVLKAMFLSKLTGALAIAMGCLLLGGTVLATFSPPTVERVGQQPAVVGNPAPEAPPVPVAARPRPQAGGTIVARSTNMVQAVSLTADSNLLAAGSMDKKVRIWDLRTNKLLQTLEGIQGIVRSVRFSPDGKTVAAGADDGVIYLWNVTTGKLDAELKADLQVNPNTLVTINAIEFLPGGKLATVCNYNAKIGDWLSRVVLWDIQNKKADTLFEEAGHSYSVVPSPDGKRLAMAFQGAKVDGLNGFQVWDLDKREVIWKEKAGDDFMTVVVWSPDGKRLAVGGGHPIAVDNGFRIEGRLWMFNAETNKRLWYVQERGNDSYSRVCFTADGKGILTGSSGPIRAFNVPGGGTGSKVISELRRWDAATGKVTWTTEGELGHFTAVAASADGKTIVGADHKQLMLFDAKTGELREVLMKDER
jgi:RNA polymerase sigma factor (sigma-70 family)